MLFMVVGCFIPDTLVASQYTLLEPSLVGGQTSVDAGDYLTTLYKYGIGVAGALAVIVFAIGGIHYMFPGHEGKGKTFMTNAVSGIVLALAAYLILNTINPDLRKMSVTLQGGTVSATPAPVSTQVSSSGNPQPGGGNALGSGAYTSSGTITRPLDADGKYRTDKIENETALRQWASSIGLTVVGTKTNNPCTYPGETGCTDLHGIRSTVQAEMLYIAQKVSGTIYVTGGTELGVHASGTYSHENGYKVDIDDTTNVNTYIYNNFTPYTDPNRSTTAYKNPTTGAIWYKEGNHWDVVAK